MKVLLLGLLLTQQSQKKCIEWKQQTKTICETNDHTFGGAAFGWLVLGPLGALAGAAMGHSNEQTCHEETTGEPVCVKYEMVEVKPCK